MKKHWLLVIVTLVLLLSLGCGSRPMSEEVSLAAKTALNAVNLFLDGELSADSALEIADSSYAIIKDFGSVADRMKESNNTMVRGYVNILSSALFLYTLGDHDYNDVVLALNSLAEFLGERIWPGYVPTPSDDPTIPTPVVTQAPRVSASESDEMILLIKSIVGTIDGFQYSVVYDAVEDVYIISMTFDKIDSSAESVIKNTPGAAAEWEKIRNTVAGFSEDIYNIAVKIDPKVKIRLSILSDVNETKIILYSENKVIAYDITRD